MGVLRSALVLLFFCTPVASAAERLTPEQVPEPLRPWIDWALHGEKQRTCPHLYNNAKPRRCAWPAELELELGEAGGRFSQRWRVYTESWTPLPGNDRRWPQAVRVNGAPALVVTRAGRPAVRLAAGEYRLTGELVWDRLPESLSIPRDSGLVSLTIDGTPVPFPEIELDGRLWLRERERGPRDSAGDRVEVQIFRRIVDEIPLQVTTRLSLFVSGTQREVLLAGPLLEGFIPLALKSTLPARLEPDGRLRLQVRPGRWTVDLVARHPGEVTALGLSAAPAPWPGTEVWVFDARNHLRLVEIEGVAPIDPRQSGLPAGWRELPAYRMKAGQTLHFKVTRRGDPQPEPDQLRLERTLWLDFDGGGYTISDRITGSMTRGWRMAARPPLRLGRVAVDGTAQFITRLPESDRDGVEVRRGALTLEADSRIETGLRRLPATGWEQDFHQVSAQLNLPPGWRLLSASGVDHVADTWINRWTMLDLFVVLIAALAVLRLWDWRWGLAALVGLALLWHEPLAPRYVWLSILTAVALLRVVPTGRFHIALRWYRNLSLIALILIAVPFMIMQVRTGMYPQLPVQPLTAAFQLATPAVERNKAAADELVRRSNEAREQKFAKALRSAPGRSAPKPAALAQFDPGAIIQTGPGLPTWQWHTIRSQWSGPVARDQEVALVLLSPTINLLLNVVRVLLVVALGLLMLGVRYDRGGGLRMKAAAFAPLLLAPWLLAAPDTARADFPSREMLQTLKERLLAVPECLPQCAQAPRLLLNVAPGALTVRLEVHVAEPVAVPLPGHRGHWTPTRVLVDGAPGDGLARGPGGELWLALSAGHHQVILSGPLPSRSSVELALPLTPHRVEVEANGWTVEGVHEDGQADRQLKLTRRRADAEQPPELAAGPLPAFVRVERTLRLGRDWQVETSVVRLSPPDSAAVLEVPLLAGESVTSEGVRVVGGKVLINLPARSSSVSWRSVLEKGAQLSLSAPQNTAWTELWRLDAGPMWHVELAGIPVVHHQDPSGRWLPEWRPWPGESVTLSIRRPVGVEGRTLTVDQSRLSVQPGERATAASLELTLRSSQGGRHTVTLPEGAVLQSVVIDGAAQPVRQEGREVTLPIAPRKQTMRLDWRTPGGMSTVFSAPAVGLGAQSVNSRIRIELGQGRWTLLAGGPRLGPAVLFWSLLTVIGLIALGLGRIPLTPITGWQWFLLGIGLSQASVWMALVVVGWLLALGARARLPGDMDASRFQPIQIGLGALTVFALYLLIKAVQQGLLGLPEMQIAGNGSSAYRLDWYQDLAGATLPQPWVVSVPLYIYRLLMLAWALWLAFALLRWLRWGWDCFTSGGLWREGTRKPKKDKGSKEVAGEGPSSTAPG